MISPPQRQLVDVYYGQLLLCPEGIEPLFDSSTEGPLLSLPSDTSAIILTGCSDGPVDVQLETYTSDPGPPDPAWEVSEEADLHIDGTLYVTSPTSTDLDLPELHLENPGLYRFRFSGRGRHIAFKNVTDEVTEHYLIQAWPAPAPQPRLTLRSDGLTR